MSSNAYTPKAILVRRRTYDEPARIEEFKALAETAGYNVVATFDIVAKPKTKYNLTIGKVEEIKEAIEIYEPDVVIFHGGLKSKQMFELMQKWDIEVKDRFQIILEIFEKRAGTVQAKLQIEKARLEHEIPFLRYQLNYALQKEKTGPPGSSGEHGVGEHKINIVQMEIRRRIALINRKLEEIRRQSEQRRKVRKHRGYIIISLAGYTNAGKSSLHRMLTGSNVEVMDEVFTTLSTVTKQIKLKGRKALLTDSVGFISDLPHTLVEAFKSTLEEIILSDLIILVVDFSDPIDEIKQKIKVCKVTFRDLEINSIPIVTALNKIDKMTQEETQKKYNELKEEFENPVLISAKTGEGIDKLIETIEQILPPLTTWKIILPNTSEYLSVVSKLYDDSEVLSEEYRQNEIIVKVIADEKIIGKLKRTTPRARIEQISI